MADFLIADGSESLSPPLLILPDSTPPFATAQIPSGGSFNVPLGAPISVKLDDTETPVLAASINLTVDDGSGAVAAITAGSFVSPFDGAGSAIVAGGNAQTITIDPTLGLASGKVYTVSVSFTDTEGNAATSSWQFDTINPNAAAAPFVLSATAQLFPLDIYPFFIKEIRDRDRIDADFFLKRFLAGPNTVWKRIVADIKSLPSIWNITEVRDNLLPYLKWIVGWTNAAQLKKITDDLDSATLRRLIAASGALWSERGNEGAIEDALTLVTSGARMRIWNWFDFRWVLDETEMGEEHEGRDPWIINLPAVVESEALVDSGQKLFSLDGVNLNLNFGTLDAAIKTGDLLRAKSGSLNGQEALILSRTTATKLILQGAGFGAAFPEMDWEIVDQTFEPDDEYRSDLRIVDDGTINRPLIKRMLRLMRPAGERWNITYLDFLDLFAVEADDLQWAPLPSGNVPVANSNMELLDSSVAEETYAIVTGSEDWTQYVVSTRIRGTSGASGQYFSVLVYYTDEDNHYRISVDTVGQTFKVQKMASAVLTDLVTVDLGAIEFNILAGVYYTLRITLVNELPNHRIQVTIDGAEIASVVTARNHTAGSIGYRHDSGTVIEVNDVELFQLPIDSDTLELNEKP